LIIDSLLFANYFSKGIIQNAQKNTTLLSLPFNNYPAYNRSMWHPKMIEFDGRMKKLFDEVDDFIEGLYGGSYSLHPMRPARGETANPEADGLFNIGANFTTGFGSDLGRGYLIDVSMSTLEKVDEDARREIYETVADKVRELLPIYFPERELAVRRDKNHFKIQGDFSLGEI
jgi:hypothetical protein